MTARIAHVRPNASFEEAFAAARKEKCDAFLWRGDKYHTLTAEELNASLRRNAPPIITRIEVQE